MMRRILLGLAFGLAGAVSSVLAAWGCVLWAPTGVDAGASNEFSLIQRLHPPVTWGFPNLGWRETGFGMTLDRATWNFVDMGPGQPLLTENEWRAMEQATGRSWSGAIGYYTLFRLEAGFPFRCMATNASYKKSLPDRPVAGSPPAHYSRPAVWASNVALHRNLSHDRPFPMLPLWPGLLANTALLGAISALALRASGIVRGRARD